MKYVQNIKQILQMGIDFGLLQTNPIAAFKCGYQHPHRDRLTMDEIMLLRDKDLILRLVPPVTFFICCFTGYAYLDVYNLTPENVITGADGNKWIIKEREKTKTLSKFPCYPLQWKL